MTALIVVGCVLAAILLLGLIKCRVDASFYEGEFDFRLAVGPVAVHPSRLRKAKKAEEPAKESTGEDEAPQKVRKKPDLAYLRALAELALRLLKRFFRVLHIDLLHLYFTSAFDDPYDTAMAYGYAGSAMEAFTAFANGRIRRLELHTEPDFDSVQPRIEVQIILSVRLGFLVFIALSALFGYRAIGRKNHSEKENEHGKSVDR